MLVGDRQGNIGFAQHFLSAVQPRIDTGVSDMRRDPHPVLAQRERLLTRTLQIAGDVLYARGGFYRIYQQRQLATSPARQHGSRLSEHLFEALRRV